MASLFVGLLGDALAALPLPIRQFHDGCATHTCSGRCRIERGSGALAAIFARAIRLPAKGHDVAVRVTITYAGNSEVWHRDFAGHVMSSRLSHQDGLLIETTGMVRFAFMLSASQREIAWTVKCVAVLGIPLPTRWFKRVGAREYAEENRYCFDVRAELPVIGLLVHYNGHLNMDATA